MDLQAFLGELVWFAPLLGKGNNLESILLINPVADLSDPALLFRVQKCRFTALSQDTGMETCNFSGCRNYMALQGG
jgi:hypothetical protein